MTRSKKSAPDLAEVVKVFRGHSGCIVKLMRAGSTFFVRKYSGNAEYNERLQNQVSKQRGLRDFIPVPAIINEGLEGELYWVEMAYISGSDFANFAIDQNLTWVHTFVSQVCSMIATFAASKSGFLNEQLILKKVHSVIDAVSKHEFYGEHKIALEKAWMRLEGADWSTVPSTRCHGDMTLENMIFCEDGEIVLIDLLDGDLESVWFDIAKLMYDLSSGWSLRHILFEQSPSQEGRLLRLLTSYASEEFAQQVPTLLPGISAILTELQILQAARVLPYTKDKKTFSRITAAIDAIVS